jgi:hypothetical protein
MAAKLTTNFSVTWTNGNDSIRAGVITTTTQTGDKAIQNVQAIGTSSEAIILGDVTGAKTLILKNLDLTHSIYVDTANPATTSSPNKIDPGGYFTTHTTTDTWYAIAVTAISNLDVFAVQD